MKGALNALREGVAEELRQSGLNAVTAMESARADRWRQAVTAVAVSGVVCAPGGFQDYLGIKRDPESEMERELYGREMELTLALDVFAPRDAGAAVCQEAAEAVMECLMCRGAAGLTALEIRAERVEFLEREGLYRLPVSCRCRAWLVAESPESGGIFTDFVVKGRLR